MGNRTVKDASDKIVMQVRTSSEMLAFGAQEIDTALSERGFQVLRLPLERLTEMPDSPCIVIGCLSDRELIEQVSSTNPIPHAMEPQGYALRVVDAGKPVILVVGADEQGAMYGALDLAESIRLEGIDAVREKDEHPYLVNRGIKFNIPLDVRTPSYTDNGEHAWKNTEVVWDMEFWHEFLDDMARYRFNVLSLWNLHPFPSMVKVPEYPDVALDDVKKNPGIYPGADLRAHGMAPPHVLDAAVTVKRMTIDEKISFWRDVMEYGAKRGIDFYLFTWNIYFYGAAGNDGIEDSPTEVSTDYYRKSVREMVLTYPLLKGIGVTSGENMGDKGEDWMYEVYARGIMDARQCSEFDPDRPFRLIHRLHEAASPGRLLEEFKEFSYPLEVSYKYSQAHMHSVPNPRTAFVDELPEGLKTWLTVRDDDFYMFRWGDPSFAREYIKSMPVSTGKIAGFYMGPDGYTWGREFISTEPDAPRQTVIGKRWYSFMLWGRLAYQPELADDLFEKTLSVRFPEVISSALFGAWAEVSKIVPLVNRSFWKKHEFDFQWYPEACYKRDSYVPFSQFIGSVPYDSSIMSIRAYAQAVAEKAPMTGTTLVQVAEILRGYAARGLTLIDGMNPEGNKELRLTLGDITAMAHLGNYYAARILGATNFHLQEVTGRGEYRDAAVRDFTEAAQHWKTYAEIVGAQYTPQILTRLGGEPVDIQRILESVQHDIEIAKGQL